MQTDGQTDERLLCQTIPVGTYATPRRVAYTATLGRIAAVTSSRRQTGARSRDICGLLPADSLFV